MPNDDKRPESPVATDDGAGPSAARHTLAGRDGYGLTLTATRLGSSTSRRDEHSHSGRFAPPGLKCGACRWFEVAIFRIAGDPDYESDGHQLPPDDARYVVHTVGKTTVPSEFDFSRIAWAETPFKVLELLTMQRDGKAARLPRASAEAVEDATRWDDDLNRAFDWWLDAGVR